jgi:hypothetical protein
MRTTATTFPSEKTGSAVNTLIAPRLRTSEIGGRGSSLSRSRATAEYRPPSAADTSGNPASERPVSPRLVATTQPCASRMRAAERLKTCARRKSASTASPARRSGPSPGAHSGSSVGCGGCTPDARFATGSTGMKGSAARAGGRKDGGSSTLRAASQRSRQASPMSTDWAMSCRSV